MKEELPTYCMCSRSEWCVMNCWWCSQMLEVMRNKDLRAQDYNQEEAILLW